MTPIGNLALACATLVGTHLGLSHPLRKPLVRLFGEAPFRGIYSLVAVACFIWITLAWRQVPSSTPAYLPGNGAWIAATAAMWLASVMLVGSFNGNPALPAPGALQAALRKPVGAFAITRHPMMWSFAIWSIVHLLLWPTPENHVVSTTILVLALAGSLGQDAKKARLMGDAWRGWSRRTAFIPFAGQIGGRIAWGAAWPGGVALIGGTVVWLLFTWVHSPLGSRMAAGIWHWL